MQCRSCGETEVLIVVDAKTSKVEADNTGIKHIKNTACGQNLLDRSPQPKELQIGCPPEKSRPDGGMTPILDPFPHEP